MTLQARGRPGPWLRLWEGCNQTAAHDATTNVTAPPCEAHEGPNVHVLSTALRPGCVAQALITVHGERLQQAAVQHTHTALSEFPMHCQFASMHLSHRPAHKVKLW